MRLFFVNAGLSAAVAAGRITPADPMTWRSDNSWKRRWALLWIATTGVVLLGSANLPWTLDDYDQAKQAFSSYQMLTRQRWFFQTTPTEGLPVGGARHTQFHISSKPPGVAWISVAFYQLTRSWDFSWRLPSFVAAVVLGLLVFRDASNYYGDLPGLLALAAFGFNILTLRLATLVRTDMPLALAVFAIGSLMFGKVRSQEPWKARERTLLFALLLAAMFIKGPIVWAFVLPPVVAYQAWHYRRPDFRFGWSGWWPWLTSFAIFLVWAVAGLLFVPGFYRDVVQVEFAGRFHEGIHRAQPLFFYLPHILQKFAPWSLLLIGTCLFLWQRKSKAGKDGAKRISAEKFWLVAWALGGVFVMSLIPSKRVDRIYPAIPSLCMLLAAEIRVLEERMNSRAGVDRLGLGLAAVSAVAMACYSGLRITNGYQTGRDALVQFGKKVREEAREHALCYEVIRSPDEGLLLYLQRPAFITVERAGELWRAGALNALVARPTDMAQLTQTTGMVCSPLIEATKNDSSPTEYALFVDCASPTTGARLAAWTRMNR